MAPSDGPQLQPVSGGTSAVQPLPPTGNPLRDGNPPASSEHPQEPPFAAPIPADSGTQPAAPPHSDQKSELTLSTRPEATAGTAAVPAVPLTGPQPPAHTAGTARPGPRTNKNSGIPFDPIKENGPIFLDMPGKTPWPTPKLALVITGKQEGYLEPCGCAGMERMKGGMSRRYTLFKCSVKTKMAGR